MSPLLVFIKSAALCFSETIHRITQAENFIQYHRHSQIMPNRFAPQGKLLWNPKLEILAVRRRNAAKL